jgi:hypothetical protein
MPETVRSKIVKLPRAGNNRQRHKRQKLITESQFKTEGRSMLHLVMAACWLILGAVLLAWQWLNPAVPSIWGTSIPLGWFAVAMALYNLVRWFLGRSSPKVRCPLQRPRDAEHTPTARTLHPDLDFTTDRPGRSEA